MTDEVPLIVQPMENGVGGGRWQPVVGPETLDFLAHVVPAASHEDVRDAAASILGRGVSPRDGVGHETGLVVGYVQSGKTMSFETATALARDNGFQMVIIVAGTSNPLLEQSTGRVRRDLRLDVSDRPRNWIHFQNPENDDSTIQTLRDVFEDWRDEGTPDEYKMTALVTVLKHHQRLGNLTELVQSVGMEGVPVLVIDDEADQASLNTEAAQGEESTTYRRLMALRDVLPLHSYLQYTATPQAPLLVSIVDSLSPNFVEVLTPGSAYAGGRDFFTESQDLVRTIPPRPFFVLPGLASWSAVLMVWSAGLVAWRLSGFPWEGVGVRPGILAFSARAQGAIGACGIPCGQCRAKRLDVIRG